MIPCSTMATQGGNHRYSRKFGAYKPKFQGSHPGYYPFEAIDYVYMAIFTLFTWGMCIPIFYGLFEGGIKAVKPSQGQHHAIRHCVHSSLRGLLPGADDCYVFRWAPEEGDGAGDDRVETEGDGAKGVGEIKAFSCDLKTYTIIFNFNTSPPTPPHHSSEFETNGLTKEKSDKPREQCAPTSCNHPTQNLSLHCQDLFEEIRQYRAPRSRRRDHQGGASG